MGRLCWCRAVSFCFGPHFEPTEKATGHGASAVMQRRESMVRVGLAQRKRGFYGRVRFPPISFGSERGDLDRFNYQSQEETIVWWSFVCIDAVESVFSFGNVGIVIFLSCLRTNQGRFGTNLTLIYVYLHDCASFVPKVPRPSLPQCCQHVYIFEKWCSFSVRTKRY